MFFLFHINLLNSLFNNYLNTYEVISYLKAIISTLKIVSIVFTNVKMSRCQEFQD